MSIGIDSDGCSLALFMPLHDVIITIMTTMIMMNMIACTSIGRQLIILRFWNKISRHGKSGLTSTRHFIS